MAHKEEHEPTAIDDDVTVGVCGIQSAPSRELPYVPAAIAGRRAAAHAANAAAAANHDEDLFGQLPN